MALVQKFHATTVLCLRAVMCGYRLEAVTIYLLGVPRLSVRVRVRMKLLHTKPFIPLFVSSISPLCVVRNPSVLQA